MHRHVPILRTGMSMMFTRMHRWRPILRGFVYVIDLQCVPRVFNFGGCESCVGDDSFLQTTTAAGCMLQRPRCIKAVGLSVFCIDTDLRSQ